MNDLPLFPDLSRRSEMTEMMDRPDCDRRKLDNTLHQFRAINRWPARARCILKRYVLDSMEPDRPYHLIDLGAGACETAVWLLNRSRALHQNLRVTACDHDHRVVQFAVQRYGDIPGLEILQRDILAIDGLRGADFVFANHLLHHLSDRRIIELLEFLTEFENATLLLNDLRRSRTAYLAYYLASPLFSRRSFARYDGLVSIRKGFLHSDFSRLVKEADPQRTGLYRIEQLFPARLLLIREPPLRRD